MRRAGPALAAFVAGFAACSAASAEAGPVRIEVDATAQRGPLEPVWAFFGYDEPNYTTTPEGLELLRTLAEVNHAKVRARTHFLFNSGDGTPAPKWGSTNVYSEDARGNPVYDYTLLDGIMDATVGAGVLPLVELGFMPEALSTRPEPYANSSTYALDGGCFYPPRDYERWGALVTAWASHVKARYPDVEPGWLWELWNEPDIAYWQGSFDEYARLYDFTEAALHAVFPNAKLGGPAVASVGNEFLAQFLEHCARGTNAVSGQAGTRLDFVSFHSKGGVVIADGNVRMNLGNQLRLHRTGFETVVASETFARTPIYITEADPDACAACSANDVPEFAYRKSPAYGAYEVAMMKRSLELAAEVGVDLRAVLTWAFTFPEAGQFAGFRELSSNGVHLPVLNAFKLLGSLRGQRVSVKSSGALPLSELLAESVRGEPDVDALAAFDGDALRVLVWNYHDELAAAPASRVNVEVRVPSEFGEGASVAHLRVDESHGNSVAAWEAQGRPEPPSASQLEELRAAMEPAVLESARAVEVRDGAVRLSFDLPRFGLSLLTLTPSAGSGRPGPPATGSGGSCQVGPRHRATLIELSPLAFAVVLLCRRRRGRAKHA